jgi:phosphoserine phosphatase RsbU/P
VARVVSISPDPGRLYRLDGDEFLMGRRLDCHIHINDQRASRRHARIRRDGSQWQLEDLGSYNGTHINGRRIHGTTRLRHGDEIEIGSSRYRIDCSDDNLRATEFPPIVIDPSTKSDEISWFEVAFAPSEISPPSSPSDILHALHRAQQKLSAMSRISELVATTLEPRALFEHVNTLLLDVFPQATAATVLTYDTRSQQLRAQSSRYREGKTADQRAGHLALPKNFIDRVLLQGHSVLLQNTRDSQPSSTVSTSDISDIYPVTNHHGSSQPVAWRMAAPLSCRGEHLGILHLESCAPEGGFNHDSLDLLSSLASQTGVAFHLIGLHQRLLARERLDYDLRLARQIQRNLLPREPPHVAGLDFSVHYEPAFQVGGDFYDFLWLDAHRLAVVIGDVSGKAISGALFMAQVTSEIRAAAPVEHSPSGVLQRVNRALNELAEDGMFTTVVYCIIDLERKVLRYANAGHPHPLLRRNGKVVCLDHPEARTIPLGIEPHLEVGEAEVEFLSGDVLLLYTDGIVEARSIRGEFYGTERLFAAMEANSDPARRTLDTVLSDVDIFVRDASQSDDQTVVCISITDAVTTTLFPFNGRRRLRRNVVHHPVDCTDFIDNP